jgi:hypothetical protein
VAQINDHFLLFAAQDSNFVNELLRFRHNALFVHEGKDGDTRQLGYYVRAVVEAASESPQDRNEIT